MPTPPYFPAYHLTVYAPRSVDSTETTVLTPIGGAPHSDPFVVTSIQNVAGAKPYLDLPKGRQGALDMLTKKATIGRLVLRILDARTTAGGGNAQRWVTAYFGDATGKLRLKGCKAVLEESLDNGATWSAIFTGRVGDLGLDSAQWVSVELRSIADDMNKRALFLGTPHSSITYAFRPSLFPVGLPQSWANGAVPAQQQIKGTFGRATGLNISAILVDKNQDSWLTLVTAQTRAFSNHLVPAYALVTLTSGANAGAVGLFQVHGYNYKSFSAVAQSSDSKVTHWRMTEFGRVEAVDLNDPLYMAVPADGTTCTFYILPAVEPSSDFPLFINDKHPVQVLADILDGKFSILNSDAGHSARPIAARDAATFSALIADPSIGTFRGVITAPAKSATDWIEKYICQPYNLGYRFDGLGRFVPIDLRPGSASVSGTIVDADLATAEAPHWQEQGDKAVFGANTSYYADVVAKLDNLKSSADEYPSVTPITSAKNTLLFVNPLADLRDAGDQTIDIDAIGIRLTAEEIAPQNTDNGSILSVDRIARLQSAVTDLLPPFAGGAATLPLRVRRSSTAGQACQVGQHYAVTVSMQPDPATNQRGGTRLMLCTSRTENGSAVDLEFLDMGANSVATVPTVGALAASAGGLDIPITLNAAGDPVRVEFIVTPAGTAARPADNDAGWVFLAPMVIASGTAHVPVVPAGKRVWVRARSQPLGKGLKLPSVWAYPAVGYLDTTAPTAPSALATSNLFANRVDIGWTVGDATLPIEVFITTGGVPASWTNAMKLQPVLTPGSSSIRIGDLTASTQYTVGVRHAEPGGGFTSMATITFNTTASAGTAPSPLAVAIAVGSSARGGSTSATSPTPPRPSPTGVPLALYAGDEGYSFEIQRASDASGTGATTIANNVSGTTQIFVDPQPLDGVTRYYRIRHVGYGDTPSAWTSFVSRAPIQIPANLARPVLVPTLDVSVSITSATQAQVSWSSTGTVQYRIDGGAWTDPGVGVPPLTVDRYPSTGADRTVSVKATFGGQVIQRDVTVKKQDAATPTISRPQVQRDSGTQFTASWSVTNMPAGTTYKMTWSVDGGSNGVVNPATSPQSVTTTLSSAPSGTVTIEAINGGVTIASNSSSGPFLT